MGRRTEGLRIGLVVTFAGIVALGCGSRTGIGEEARDATPVPEDAMRPAPAPVDAGVVADAARDAVPDAPPDVAGMLARFPWNGYATGSLWGERRAADHHTSRRPTFQWEPMSDTDFYELRLDDDCTTNDTCDYPSPELFVFEGADSTRVVIDRDLDVDLTPPVGRRYFWSVRACRTADGAPGCSDWTATRYLDVGRQRADYDGDGWADAVVSAQRWERMGIESMAHFVFAGSPEGLSSMPAVEILPERHSLEPTNVGDLNADGFADFAVMVSVGPGPVPSFGYIAHIHYGSADGLSPTPSLVLEAADPWCAYGANIVGPGDLDGDGFGDLTIAVQQPGTCGDGDRSRGPAVNIFHFRADGPQEGDALWFAGPFSSFGRAFRPTIGGVGDVHGDGYPDVLVGIVDFIEQRPATLFGGSKAGLSDAASSTIRPGSWEFRSYFPSRIPSVGDVNGDGFADIIAVRRPAYESDVPGVIYVYEGARSGPPERPTDTLLNETDAHIFAQSVSGGDFDGDGFGDLAFNVGDYTDQRIHVHRGTPRGLDASFSALVPPGVPPARSPVLVVSSPGDFDGDGVMDLVLGAPHGNGAGEVSIWSGSAGALPRSHTDLPSPTDRPRTGFGVGFADSTW